MSNYNNLPKSPHNRRGTKSIKRERFIKRFSRPEQLMSIMSGLMIIIIASPFVIFYIVSSKNPLSLELIQQDSIDQVVVIEQGLYGNIVKEKSVTEVINKYNIPDEQKSFLFESEDTIQTFCNKKQQEGLKTIVVLTFDYLLPYITYDCSKKGIIVYGEAVEGEQKIRPSIIDRFGWSMELFFE